MDLAAPAPPGQECRTTEKGLYVSYAPTTRPKAAKGACLSLWSMLF